MSSDLLDKLIKALTVLPGVGKKSAQRMALYLLDKNKSGAKEIASSLSDALDNIQRCKSCRMLTCLLYTSPSPRDPSISRMPSSA